MNSEIFDIIIIAVNLILSIVGALVAHKLIPYLQANTTEKQRKEAVYWIEKAILITEIMFKDKKAGILKKEDVLLWLSKNKINVTEDQADILIDLIVKEWNAKGWPYDINMQRLK